MERAPRIYDYSDVIVYLTACFVHRKEQEPGFTTKAWSEEMGLKTPDSLIAILKGKKPLKLKYLDFLEKGLKLESSEKIYLQVLIQHARAEKPREKKAFELLLALLSPGRGMQVTQDTTLFSDWMSVALLSLCHIETIDEDAAVRAFSDRAEAGVVRAAIEKMLERGLLAKDAQGYLKRTGIGLTSPNDGPNAGGKAYYKQVSELAKHAADIRAAEREFQCFSFAMNPDKLALAKELIRSFRNQLSALCDGEATQVYQANLQLFPVTKAVPQPGVGHFDLPKTDSSATSARH